MILPERFVLTFEGRREHVTRRANIVPNELAAMLAHVLKGGIFSPDDFRALGFRLSCEEDTDQCEAA